MSSVKPIDPIDHVLLQLANKSKLNIQHSQQYNELLQVLRRCCINKENEAVLLMSYRGSGQHMLLETVLYDIQHNELAKRGVSMIQCYINGAILSNDTQALKEICKQLSKKTNNSFEKLSNSTSYHELLNYLSVVLSSSKLSNCAIIFILDEFDHLADKAEQTLLYNLSDLLQSNQTQMTLIGITTRMDIHDLLGKRIKSRMSYHRIVIPIYFTF